MALVTSLFLARIAWGGERLPAADPHARRGWLFSFFLWLVLTLPLLVLVKPAVTALIIKLTATLPLGRDPGLDYASSGTLFMIGWLALFGILAGWGGIAGKNRRGLDAPPAGVAGSGVVAGVRGRHNRKKSHAAQPLHGQGTGTAGGDGRGR